MAISNNQCYCHRSIKLKVIKVNQNHCLLIFLVMFRLYSLFRVVQLQKAKFAQAKKPLNLPTKRKKNLNLEP